MAQVTRELNFRRMANTITQQCSASSAHEVAMLLAGASKSASSDAPATFDTRYHGHQTSEKHASNVIECV